MVDVIPSLQWFMYNVPLDRSVDLPAITASLKRQKPVVAQDFLKYREADMFLQNKLARVHVPRSDVANLAQLVNTLLSNRAMGPGINDDTGR